MMVLFIVGYSEVNVRRRVGLKPYAPHAAVSTTRHRIRLGEKEENPADGHPLLVRGILGVCACVSSQQI